MLQGLDVMAIGLWSDRHVETRFPVILGFAKISGSTFNLNQLHVGLFCNAAAEVETAQSHAIAPALG